MAPLKLKDLSIAELVSLHNQTATRIGSNTVKKFRDKATAIKRTKAILKEANSPKEKKATDKKKDIRKIQFPLEAGTKGRLHRVQEDSLKGKLVKLLLKGATRAQMGALFTQHDKEKGKTVDGSPEKRAWNTMLVLHKDIGFGVFQKGEKFFAVEPTGKEKAKK